MYQIIKYKFFDISVKYMLIKNFATQNKKASDSVNENRKLFIQKYLENSWKKVLYVHIPFCTSKCKYCICETKACNDENAFDRHIQLIKEQINLYYDIFKSVKFEQVYFGGGTPTILDAKKLERLFTLIPDFEKIPIKCIECSPNTLSVEHLQLFQRYNFSFISMGVQTLQENICKWQNRYYVTKEELRLISKALSNSNIYFNYDMICYLGKGDIRDIPKFKEDLSYIMKYCKPSSICIHQHHQTEFSEEKTRYLINLLKELTDDKDLGYECINSQLEEEDVKFDTMYQAQYRLVREKRNFNHYMWKRYPMIPVKDYDVLGIGYMEKIQVKSNAKDLLFSESKNIITKIEFLDFVYEDYRNIRIKKHLDL